MGWEFITRGSWGKLLFGLFLPGKLNQNLICWPWINSWLACVSVLNVLSLSARAERFFRHPCVLLRSQLCFPETHRNRNDPLIQCDSLCCYSTLGWNCWITQFLMEVHFLKTLFVFVVTAVCSAVGVCLLPLKLGVLIPLRAIRTWFLCNPHDFHSGYEKFKNA